MDSGERAKRFIEQFQGAMRRGAKGKVEVDTTAVQALVRQDTETAALAVQAYLTAAMENRALLQSAVLIATAYQIETNDDSLMVLCQAELEKPGAPPMPPIGFRPKTKTPALRVFEVDSADLARGDAFNFIRLMSIERADEQDRLALAQLAGRCTLAFPLDSDPRHVAHIPAARRWVAASHQALPYFPYYLNDDPRIGAFITYFGCIADLEALQDLGGGKVSLVLNHPSLLSRLVETLTAVQSVADLLGESPRPTFKRILRPYPKDMRRRIIGALG